MQCPHCSQDIDLGEVSAGTSVQCPICGGGFIVGASSRPTSAPTPPPEQNMQQGPDGLQMAAPSLWHVVTPDGQRFGPVGESEVIAWIQEGRIGVDARVWRNGLSDWVFIDETLPFSRYYSRHRTGTDIEGFERTLRRASATISVTPAHVPSIRAVSGRGPKPERPASIYWGIGLYVASTILGIREGCSAGTIVGPPPSDAVLVAAVLALGVLLLVLAVDLLGLIMACLGYAWGAILMLCTAVVGYLVVAAINSSSLLTLANVAGIVCLVCFLLPPSWEYYRRSAAYRARQ